MFLEMAERLALEDEWMEEVRRIIVRDGKSCN